MTITWEQVLAFLCEDQTMAITSLLFLAFFAAVALINYALPRVLRPYFLLAASYGFFCFVPVNRPIWDALFPDWEAVQPTLDLIVGYPEPYDAVAAHSPDGQAHLIFDLIRWCNYAELDQLDSIIRNLLTHEITHLLIGHRYPAADAALESTDYLTRLDAYTFHEGFAHLLSYQATEIDCVDWHTPQLTEVAAASRAKLRLALTETDPDRQKQFLEEAVCGSYYEKFACMCGMLYLADRWETQGIDGLQCAFADYHGFAQRALSIRI